MKTVIEQTKFNKLYWIDLTEADKELSNGKDM